MTETSPASTDPRGRVYGGQSLADRLAQRRERFMDAGLEVFGTTGYRTATVRQLCRQAGLTDRYFYESFDTTEDLLMAVYRRQFDQLQQAVLQAVSTRAQPDHPMPAVEAGLNALFHMAADPRVARVCWLEVLGVSPRVDALYTSTFDGFAQLVIGFARTFYPQWQVDVDEERILGVALVGAVSQSVQHWLLGRHRESHETMVRATARVFRGLISTLG